jgi:hypothetical protein
MNKASATSKSTGGPGGDPSDALDEDDISTPKDDTQTSTNSGDTSAVFASAAAHHHQEEEARASGNLGIVQHQSKDSLHDEASAADCPTPPTPPLPETLSSRGEAKRLSSSIEHVDLEYSLGSLDAHPPYKRMCSSETKKKLHTSPLPPIKSAADALKPKFWRDSASVSEHNIASTSFDVADEEGGSSPLSVGDGDGDHTGTVKNTTTTSILKRRLTNETQRSIEAAEDVMRVATLAASKMSEGGSTPPTPPVTNEKDKELQSSAKGDTPLDDFDMHVQRRDTNEDKDLDSNISSASSLAEAFVPEEEYSRPFPPAPPSTPAAPRDSYQPLPYQAGVTSGELGYSIEFKRTQATVDGTAPTPRPDYTVKRASVPPPPYFDPEAPTPLPDREPPSKPTQHGAARSDISGDTTVARRGAATPGGNMAPKLAKKTDFDKWDVGDRYQLKRTLGRGSYGEVAQAVDLHAVAELENAQNELEQQTQNINPHCNSTYVAVKKISKAFDQEVDAIRLFREIHILRRLRGHECVIQLIDVVQPRSSDLKHFNDLYLVFEYVDTDLYKLIMSPQYLTTEHIQTFLYQMLVGLKFIHSSSVIHRDLKPA